ncbi:YybS family protein [Bacillus sp. BRMEA1]|uniref:YybS family protein n=1 Tax=Neobacillus endophyticus TaxID=2738405 RepID=UPI00156630C0|nr:YybS family protein [Neobacillus endophyticus]NRD77402.1 YybS family protein [Neobacillus endophyticus]
MKNVNKLTEGAILLAIFAVLILITIYVPIIGSFLNLLLPLPFILFSAKNDLKLIGAFTIAAVFISFLAGSFLGISITLIYGITGIILGYLLQKNRSRTMILIAGSLTFLAGTVIFYVVSASFFHFDIIHEIKDAFKQSSAMSENMLKAMGKADQIETIKKQNEDTVKMITTLAPSFMILASIIIVMIIQWICFPIAKRFGVQIQQWGNFRNLSLPKSLLWYFLIALGANFLFHPQDGTFLYTVIQNAVYILEMFLMVQGLSFLLFMLYQKSTPKGIGIIIVLLAFTIPIVHYIIMLLGITDLGFNFRKRFINKE